MSFKVKVGPPQIAIHWRDAVLLTEENGEIGWPTDKGLYFRDTRLMSAWSIYANGEPWTLLNGGATACHASRICLTNPNVLTQDGVIPERTLDLVLRRQIEKCLREDIDIANHGHSRARFNLEIALRCDFADIFEVRSRKIVRRGKITTIWDEDRQSLCNAYVNGDFERSLLVSSFFAPAVYANGRLSMDIDLDVGEKWHGCLTYEYTDAGHTETCRRSPPAAEPNDAVAREQHAWRSQILRITTSNEEYYRFYTQAIDDMQALRMPIGADNNLVYMPAAGLPWFMAPFGRDSLIAAMQCTIVHAFIALDTLSVLADLQATERDDYRDAEPGKIMHELRRGELAHFKLIPHTPYYGTADATPLWLIALHSAWRSSGDMGLLDKHMRTAEACLEWIDRSGDLDGDGFQEYQTRSMAGYENMGWKDSGDAVIHPDGTQVKGPKALCELQGYVYDAWRRMSHVYEMLGDKSRAKELQNKAAALYEHFNDAFWDEEGGFYAYALDGDKKPVLTVASNPGHCLLAGIVPRDRARRVADRLLADDMWTRWGIRTLSDKNRAFNPNAYQLGSIWPHDNSIIAMGFKRYGFHAEVARVARGISGATAYFQGNQIPELFTGTSAGFPVQYLGSE